MKKIISIFFAIALMQNYEITSMFPCPPLQNSSQSMQQYTPIKIKLEALHDSLYDSQNEALDSGAKKRKFDQVTSEVEKIRYRVANFIQEPIDSLPEVRRKTSQAIPGVKSSAFARSMAVQLTEETLGMLPTFRNKQLIGSTFIHPQDLQRIEIALLEEGYVYKGPGRSARPATEKEKADYEGWKQRKKAFEDDQIRQAQEAYRRANSGVVTFRPVSGSLSSEMVTISKLSDLW